MKNFRLRLTYAWPALLVLSTTSSAQTLILERHGAAPTGRFGTSVAALGDINGDGAGDWIVGAPRDDTLVTDGGMAVVYSGATHQPLYTYQGTGALEELGTSVAGAQDLTGDGVPDILIGAPGRKRVDVHSGATGLLHYTVQSTSNRFGYHVAAGGDVDGDGVNDILVGAPGSNIGGSAEVGRLFVLDGPTGAIIRSHDGNGGLGRFGHSAAFIGDVNGDGRDDYIGGAPGPNYLGPTPYVRTFDGATGAMLWGDTGAGPHDAFGYSLAAIDDITGDGFPDVLIGDMQDTGVGCGPCHGRGFVRALSGANGAFIYEIGNQFGGYSGYGWSIAVVGDINGNGYADFAASRPGTDSCWPGFPVWVRDGLDGSLILEIPPPSGAGSFGAALAFGDANGDGIGDLISGAPCSQPNGSYSGAAYVHTFVREPRTYCETKLNSLGCAPFIQGVGTPSATAFQPFRIKAFNVLSHKPGLLFYGPAPRSMPFQGGRLCVDVPLRRTSVQFSGGNPPPTDCSGTYGFDFNHYIRRGVDPTLVAGEEVFAQYWSRDPSSPSGTGLTDALGFFIYP